MVAVAYITKACYCYSTGSLYCSALGLGFFLFHWHIFPASSFQVSSGHLLYRGMWVDPDELLTVYSSHISNYLQLT